MISVERPQSSQHLFLNTELSDVLVGSPTRYTIDKSRFAQAVRDQVALGARQKNQLLFAHENGDLVAIKYFHPGKHDPDSDERRQAVISEAIFRHDAPPPYVVGVKAAFMIQTHPFPDYLDRPALAHVMEFIPSSQHLTTIIQNGPLNLDQAIDFATQFAHIVDDLSTQKPAIYLKDHKPENSYVKNGRILISDFEEAYKKPVPNGQTFDGTLYYAPPEATQLSHRGRISELYTIALITYELITGKRYREEHLFEINMPKKEQPLKIQESNGLVPDAVGELWQVLLRKGLKDPRPLIDVLQKELHNDPSRRYYTGADYAQALKSAYMRGM
jgi:serine/threonine protein kinase